MIKKITAELIGSMILVITAVSSFILFDMVFESPIYVTVFSNAIAVAFVLVALIEIFTPISGAHFNPVVTMVFLFEKKLNIGQASIYIIIQIIGGIVGTVLSHLMFYDHVNDLVAVSEIARGGSVFYGEIIGTFVLVFVILMLVKIKSSRAPLVVGFLVGGQVMATSSTLFANPQVTIARMLSSTGVGIRPMDGVVFIIMQFIGALLAYGVYKLLK